jgi:hypothetical protein
MIIPEDQFYRPTRARELRRQAARLRDWLHGTREVIGVGLGLFAAFSALIWLLVPLQPEEKALGLCGEALLGLLALQIAGPIYWCWFVLPVRNRINHIEREAVTLECEHLARWSSPAPPPPSQDDPVNAESDVLPSRALLP